MDKLNVEFKNLALLVRKFHGKLIIISQQKELVDVRLRELLVAEIEKTSRKTAVLKSTLFKQPIILANIPKTSIHYDSYDIAEFKMKSGKEKKYDERIAQIVWLRARGLSFEKIAKTLNISSRTAHRLWKEVEPFIYLLGSGGRLYRRV